MKQLIFIILISLIPFTGLKAQKKDSSDFTLGLIQGGDTIIYRNIKEVLVFPHRKFDSQRIERKYWRYVEKVKKVYPLAVEARKLLERYEPVYYSMTDKRERRNLMKKLEKELLDEHKEELKKWSITDGKILLKLINRETERTPFSLIQDFRGDFSAVFWQGIALIFRNDLKSRYDPNGEDQWLEEIVTLIELGYL